MGYIILRQNKTFEEQLTQTNTIYEIRYDFDLNNQVITIPDNCVLKFEGGCLKNGKLEINNTYIKSSNSKIFKNIQVVGSSSSNIKASWWDTFDYNNEKQTEIFKSILNINSERINIDADFHLVNPNIEVTNKENCILDFYGSHIYVDESDYTLPSPVTYRCLRLMTSNNVTIKGMRVTGDVLAQYTKNSFPTEGNLLCHGIDIYDCQNITVDDCIIDEMVGDSLNLGGNSLNKDIHITNCKFSSNRRQGISILCGSDIYIYNCTIKDIGKYLKEWGCCIDIEPWRNSDYVKNVIIDSCYIGDTVGQRGSNIAVIGTAFENAENSVVSEVSITNCICQGDIFVNNVLNTCIERTTLRRFIHRSNGVNDSDVYTVNLKKSSLCAIYTDMKASYTVIEDCIINIKNDNISNYIIWCQGKGLEMYNTTVNGHGKSSFFDILPTQKVIIENCRFEDERISTSTNSEQWARIEETKNIKIVNTTFHISDAVLFNNTGKTLVDNCSFTMEKLEDGGIKEYAVHFRTRYYNQEHSKDQILLRNNKYMDCNYLYYLHHSTSSSYNNCIYVANYILHDNDNELVKPDDGSGGVFIEYKTVENSIKMTPNGIMVYKSSNWEYLNYTQTGNWYNKPTNPAIGTSYYCTDKKNYKGEYGLVIYYIGNDLWSDALGEVVNYYYPKPKKGTFQQAKNIEKVSGTLYNEPLPEGYTYFCTDKFDPSNEESEGIMIIWTGTNWVDTLGRIIS